MNNGKQYEKIDVRDLPQKQLAKLVAILQEAYVRELHITNGIIQHLMDEEQNYNSRFVYKQSVKRHTIAMCLEEDFQDVLNGTDGFD